MMKILAAFGILLLAWEGAAHAACSWDNNTGTVASPYALTDLQACITDAATKTGEVTILIPNSDVNYSGSITVNMRTSFASVTSLTIRGQNDCSLDTTYIPTGVPSACGTNITNVGVSFTGSPTKRFRFAHVRLVGPAERTFYVYGDTAYPAGGFRIDHVLFDHYSGTTARGIWFYRTVASYGKTNGVFDHNRVIDPPAQFFHTLSPNGNGGNLEWMTPLGLGTEDAIYIEDNHFSMTTDSHAISESQSSGRYVFRHNYFYNCYHSNHDAIIGWDEGTVGKGYRGVRKMEFYNNTYVYGPGALWKMPIDIRGGNGVIFNNTLTVSGVSDFPTRTDGFAHFSTYRTYQLGGGVWDSLVDNSGRKACLNTVKESPRDCSSETDCIGGIVGTTNYCVTIDNPNDPNGYPGRDSLGVVQNSDGSQTKGGQPFLMWNNTYNGNNQYGPNVATSDLSAGVDYCVASDWVTMPASCNGVTTTYVPYTYPHPLVTGTPDVDATPPYRYNGSPSGSLAQGTTETTVSVVTSDSTPPSLCRHSDSPGTAWASMTVFSSEADGVNHSYTKTGLTDGGSYDVYVKCQDSVTPTPNTNPDDYHVAFSVASGGGGGTPSAPSIVGVTLEGAAIQ